MKEGCMLLGQSTSPLSSFNSLQPNSQFPLKVPQGEIHQR